MGDSYFARRRCARLVSKVGIQMAFNAHHGSVDDPGVQRKAVSHVWMLYAAVGAAAILVYYQLPKGGIAQAILLTAANGSAVVAAVRAAVRTTQLNRLIWVALAAAMGLSTLANGPYYLYPLITGNAIPFPGPV